MGYLAFVRLGSPQLDVRSVACRTPVGVLFHPLRLGNPCPRSETGVEVILQFPRSIPRLQLSVPPAILPADMRLHLVLGQVWRLR